MAAQRAHDRQRRPAFYAELAACGNGDLAAGAFHAPTLVFRAGGCITQIAAALAMKDAAEPSAAGAGAILEVGLASPCETQMSDVGQISGLQLQKEARPQRAHARLHASGKCIRQEILVKTLLRKICSFTDTGVGLNSV